ncbi:MAG TPA: ABC transporter permease [Nocardioidaceae bacterium]|jgi:lipooligosaccharide transport system permease protein|nr:ABC transporter permease [Nocardioidaceae bacterium]
MSSLTTAHTKPAAGTDGAGSLVLRQIDHWRVRWRRTWRGSAITNFVLPVLYLLGMGIGLGAYVDEGGAQDSLGGLPYLDFIAPGLLATTVFQNAVGASTWPVLGALKWDKTYYAMLATPLRVRDILLGNLWFIAARLTLTGAVFLGVLVAFGIASSPWALLALPAAVLVGMAHATPCFAYAATIQRETGFMLLYRLGVVPMFLFSGAFFPISQLPTVLEWVARVLPLTSGVELLRDLVLGTPDLGRDLLYVAYLALWVLAGFWLADRRLARRLGDG